MKFVEIYKLKNDGSQEVLVVCRLSGNEAVCEGNESFVKNLNENGIRDYAVGQSEKLFPKHGLRFLEQLKYNFKSGYLMASDVKEK